MAKRKKTVKKVKKFVNPYHETTPGKKNWREILSDIMNKLSRRDAS